MKLLTCKNCSWVHFGKTFDEVFEELSTFRKYYETLSKKDQQEMYGGKCSSITDYMYCFRCEAFYTEMRKTKNSEVPTGSTIQPILITERNKKHGKQGVRRTKRQTNNRVSRKKNSSRKR